MTSIAQWLRNAFEAHDHDDFYRAVTQVEQLELREARRQADAARGDENPQPQHQHTVQ